MIIFDLKKSLWFFFCVFWYGGCSPCYLSRRVPISNQLYYGLNFIESNFVCCSCVSNNSLLKLYQIPLFVSSFLLMNQSNVVACFTSMLNKRYQTISKVEKKTQIFLNNVEAEKAWLGWRAGHLYWITYTSSEFLKWSLNKWVVGNIFFYGDIKYELHPPLVFAQKVVAIN